MFTMIFILNLMIFFFFFRSLHLLHTKNVKPICNCCNQNYTKCAVNTGCGWWLFWECENCSLKGYENLIDMNWPYGELEIVSMKTLQRDGFKVI